LPHGIGWKRASILPQRAVAEQDVEDGANAPGERGDDEPQELLERAEVGAAQNIDPRQYDGDRVKYQ